MQSLTMLEFRKRAEAVLEKVRKGQRFVLTYRGKAVARLEPIEPAEIGDDPIYELDQLASERAKPLTNREIDRASMARELFVDTSGFFALLAKRDPNHQAARKILARAKSNKRRLVTTDYVLDETATLLKARGEGGLAGPFFDRVFGSAACRVDWADAQQFDKARAFFLKHNDQEWSFTDCLSFCVMKALRLQDALTTDVHFEQAGFRALLR